MPTRDTREYYIAKLKSEGYSDEEIAAHLQQESEATRASWGERNAEEQSNDPEVWARSEAAKRSRR